MYDLEHPDITRLMRDGMPEEETRYCPCCGKEAEYFYIQDYKVIGCDRCIECCDAYEYIGEY